MLICYLLLYFTIKSSEFNLVFFFVMKQFFFVFCFIELSKNNHCASNFYLLKFLDSYSLAYLFYILALGESYKKWDNWEESTSSRTTQQWGKQREHLWTSQICFYCLWSICIWNLHEATSMGFAGFNNSPFSPSLL